MDVSFINGFLDWLTAHQEIWLPLAVSGLLSWFCALTPTLDPNSTAGKLYHILEALAGNILKAKETGQSGNPTGGQAGCTRFPAMVLALLLALAVVVSCYGCSTLAPSPAPVGAVAGTTSTAASTSSEIVTDSYKVLKTTGVTYDAAMKAMGDLYRQRLISEGTKAKTIEIGTQFWSAYHSAVDALLIYQTTRLADDQSKANAAIGETLARLAEIQSCLSPVIGGKK